MTQLDGIIPEEKRGIAGFEQVEVGEGFHADAEFACWVKKNAPKPTGWSSWLEEGFAFEDRRPETMSSGCAVLVLAAGRVFAACFGTGRHVIPEELVECEFGFIIALNEVNPKQLRTLVTESIDIRTRQRDTHQIHGADVPEFTLLLGLDWLGAAPQLSGIAGVAELVKEGTQ